MNWTWKLQFKEKIEKKYLYYIVATYDVFEGLKVQCHNF